MGLVIGIGLFMLISILLSFVAVLKFDNVLTRIEKKFFNKSPMTSKEYYDFMNRR